MSGRGKREIRKGRVITRLMTSECSSKKPVTRRVITRPFRIADPHLRRIEEVMNQLGKSTLPNLLAALVKVSIIKSRRPSKRKRPHTIVSRRIRHPALPSGTSFSTSLKSADAVYIR